MEPIHTDYEIISPRELIVGNHDSLILYGSETQQNLREFSKSLSAMLLNSNGDIEYLINDILNEINDFQESITGKSFFPFLQSESVKRDKLIKRYDAVLVCIDKMEIALKLQEAQLIKDSKMIEEIGKQITDSINKLETAVEYGKTLLMSKQTCKLDDDLENWYVRLSKRIEDLEISHTVSLQIQVQMQLMLENNTQLIDRILAAISGTIPIWRNQVTLLLGIERMNRNQEVQNKVFQITQTYLDTAMKKSKKAVKRSKRIDTEKLLLVNDKLRKSLDEIIVAENRDSDIRLEFNNSLM